MRLLVMKYYIKLMFRNLIQFDKDIVWRKVQLKLDITIKIDKIR